MELVWIFLILVPLISPEVASIQPVPMKAAGAVDQTGQTDPTEDVSEQQVPFNKQPLSVRYDSPGSHDGVDVPPVDEGFATGQAEMVWMYLQQLLHDVIWDEDKIAEINDVVVRFSSAFSEERVQAISGSSPCDRDYTDGFTAGLSFAVDCTTASASVGWEEGMVNDASSSPDDSGNATQVQSVNGRLASKAERKKAMLMAREQRRAEKRERKLARQQQRQQLLAATASMTKEERKALFQKARLEFLKQKEARKQQRAEEREVRRREKIAAKEKRKAEKKLRKLAKQQSRDEEKSEVRRLRKEEKRRLKQEAKTEKLARKQEWKEEKRQMKAERKQRRLERRGQGKSSKKLNRWRKNRQDSYDKATPSAQEPGNEGTVKERVEEGDFTAVTSAQPLKTQS